MEIKGYVDLQIIFVIEYLAVKFNVVHEKLFVGRTASKSGEQLIFSPYCLCVMLLVDSYFFHIPISKIPKQKCVSGHSEQLLTYYICLTSLTRAKCGTRSTLCWKVGNISGSTELFAL